MATAEHGTSDNPRHRSFIGPSDKYDIVASMQFNLLTTFGLREHHHLLDIGCGSLRAGRLFILYLLPGRYCGLEPEKWLIEEGIDQEIGRDLIRLKQPAFRSDSDFRLSAFERPFDFAVAQSIFSHATAGQIRTCLAEIAKVLRPDGVFLATYVKGDADYTGHEWVYPGCVTYSEATMSRMAAEAGLALRPVACPHPNGQSWVAITHPGGVSALPSLDAAAIPGLGQEIRALKDRWDRLRHHPLVRVGRWASRCLRKLGCTGPSALNE
jgi:SAM-dependent methyltransferase